MFDVLLRNGLIYDGSGEIPFTADVALNGDHIVEIGEISGSARLDLDVSGLAVAPGFINMMCWGNESLIEDGRSQSDIRQGVTLEVLGEGWSMGPLNDELKDYKRSRQGDIRYDISWTSLDEYLTFLTERGVSPNVASFVGAGIVRTIVLGFEDRRPSSEELAQMEALTAQAMVEGALGVSSALIYAPDSYADTAELSALARVSAAYDGIYITHLRSESDTFFEALDEFMSIVRDSGVRGEIYHLKASGRENWPKMDEVIKRVEAARAEGLPITADMYTYNASSTGLDAMMPGWVEEGGQEAWIERLKDPQIRQRLVEEICAPDCGYDNSYQQAGSPDRVLLVSFRSEALKSLTGKSLAEVAAMRGTPPLETAFDLIIEDNSRVGTIFFTMSEENVRKEVALPWVSFCSDSATIAPEGVFLKSNPHPRAYGSFARLLGKYVREEQIITLPEAIRRLAALPADTLKLDRRGRLQPGYFADVVVFDPETIRDNATFADPHQYATGMRHVFVNGVAVLQDGEHTGALPGQVVRGPGYQGS